MSQCATYSSMCSSGGGSSSYLCGSSGSTSTSGFTGGPVMRMFLNQDTPYFLLFPTWTPSTPRECAGAWFAIFALALVTEVFRVGANGAGVVSVWKTGVVSDWKLALCLTGSWRRV
jgi:hypothetical protein